MNEGAKRKRKSRTSKSKSTNKTTSNDENNEILKLKENIQSLKSELSHDKEIIESLNKRIKELTSNFNESRSNKSPPIKMK